MSGWSVEELGGEDLLEEGLNSGLSEAPCTSVKRLFFTPNNGLGVGVIVGIGVGVGATNKQDVPPT